MAKKKTRINADLEKLLSTLLKEAGEKEPIPPTDGIDNGERFKMPFDDRMKVIDRALKLEQLKAKIEDDEFGSGFDEPDDADE